MLQRFSQCRIWVHLIRIRSNRMVDACRTQLDLKTVGRIIFEFCFLPECNVRTRPLLEIDLCRQLELAFAFGTYVRTEREAEYIFGFEFPERVRRRVLRARKCRKHNKQWSAYAAAPPDTDH